MTAHKSPFPSAAAFFADKPTDSESLDAVPMADVLLRAAAVTAELTHGYPEWAHKDIEACRELLEAARNDPGRSRAFIKDLFAIAHNIKGQGTSFGYPLMTAIGQSLCTLTRAPQDNPQCILDLLAIHLDAMDMVLAHGIKGRGGLRGEQLVGYLTALAQRYVHADIIH